MIIFSATQGYADDIPVPEISNFNGELRTYLNQQFPEIGDDIAATKDLTAETEAKLRSAINAFKEVWFADRGES
jgi:F-type H+-transporting ATPase subunit alpha